MSKKHIILSAIISVSLMFSMCFPLFSDNEPVKLIYIVSSYDEEMSWSSELAEKISTKIKQTYPDYDVAINYFKANAAQTNNALHFSTRSIFQYLNTSYTEDESYALSQTIESIFTGVNQFPKAFVFIGDDVWNSYRSYALYNRNLKDIPIILSAVSDSLNRLRWTPNTRQHWRNVGPAEEQFINGRVLKRAYDRNPNIGDVVSDLRLTDSSYIVRIPYNVTGVISPSRHHQTIELMMEMYPETKKIVFFDNLYYNTLYCDHKLRNIIANTYPDVEYEFILQTIENADSVFNYVSQYRDDVLYLTNAWEINSSYSMFSKESLDSLFTYNKRNPVFSLLPKPLNNNWDIGGSTLDVDECADKTFDLLTRVIQGERADSLAFKYLEKSEPELNVSALKRYGQYKQTLQSIPDAHYVNYPIPFLRKYQGQIYIFSILFLILFGITIIQVIHYRHLRSQIKESDRYKLLYNELQTIYNNTYIDFAIYDKNGNSLIHIESAEINNKTLAELLPENLFSNKYLSEKMKEDIWSHNPINEEITIETKKSDSNPLGKELYQFIIKPLDNLSYRSASFMAAVINLTPVLREKNAKERVESLLEFASESCNVGIAYYNLFTRTGYANTTWYENLNEAVKPAPKIESSLENISSKDRVEIWDYFKKMREGKMEPFVRDIYVSDGLDGGHWIRQYIYQMNFDPANRIIDIVELNINIDIQKQGENKLSQARTEAELSNKETEEFLANISHEVRTPLNAIIGFSNVLALTEEMSEELASLGDIIRKNNDLLYQLLSDILLLSKFDSGMVELNYTDVDLNLLIADIESFALASLREKSIEIKVNTPQPGVIINSDGTFLSIVLKHLLTNAIKFTESGTITFGYHQEDQYCYFFVEDSGLGIEKDKQEVIFKRFEKLDSFVQGSGLGLPICKSVINTLGGDIGISSKLGKGSVFWFILPISHTQEESDNDYGTGS